VSILNLVMIDLLCLYAVGVHSFLCLSVGAQVWMDNLGGIQSKSVKMCPYILQSGSV
jgi:hypothetical protein